MVGRVREEEEVIRIPKLFHPQHCDSKSLERNFQRSRKRRQQPIRIPHRDFSKFPSSSSSYRFALEIGHFDKNLIPRVGGGGGGGQAVR